MSKKTILCILLAAVVIFASAMNMTGCKNHNQGKPAEAGHAEGEKHEGEKHEGEKHEEGEEEEGEEHGLKLTQGQLKLSTIKDTPAAVGDIDVELLLTGEVGLDLDHTAHIKPRAGGKAHSVKAGLGRRAAAGEVLAVIESSEVGAAKAAYLEKKQQAELARADFARAKEVHDNTGKMLKALASSESIEGLDKLKGLDAGGHRSAIVASYSEMTFARAIYEREKNLHGKEITSKGDLLDAENKHRQAEAEFKATVDEVSYSIKRELLEKKRAMELAELSMRAAGRDLRMLGAGVDETRGAERGGSLSLYPVRAPFRGTVIEKSVSAGELVAEDSDMFVISNLDTVWIMASVYEKDVPKVKTGQGAAVKVKAYPGKSFRGKVAWVSDKIDEDTRTLKARVEVDNRSGLLKPGMFAEVGIGVEKKRGVLVIPAEALMTKDGQTIVFVREGDAKFESREVAIGARSLEEVEITGGLEEGERVVVEGGFLLKSESGKGSGEDAHGH